MAAIELYGFDMHLKDCLSIVCHHEGIIPEHGSSLIELFCVMSCHITLDHE